MSEPDQRQDSTGMRWEVRRVTETGSTNADLAEAARTGAPEGSVLVAEYQNAGRGRLTRGWSSPPGAGLTFSVLLRPESVPGSRWGWLPAVAGLAVSDAMWAAVGVHAELKWPNDVLVRDRKVCGILGEVVTGFSAVVIGIGLNVASTVQDLPSTGTSVSMVADRPISPDALLSPVLDGLHRWYGRWRTAGGDADSAGVRPACRERSATLGRQITVRAAGDQVTGKAVDLDVEGRLVLRTSGGELRTFGSGDVIHASLQ